MFNDSEKVSIEEHRNWFDNLLIDKSNRAYIVEENKIPSGVIRFQPIQKDSSKYDVSINIAPEKRGKGIGKFLLMNGIKKLKMDKNNCKFIIASVKKINKNSNFLFKSCGFKKYSDNDELIEYILKIF